MRTSIHTYPKHHALFFDIFTCGGDCNTQFILSIEPFPKRELRSANVCPG
ncbi:MAG: S-adenosylmethionine decarboxylase [Treponema sp.]|nr:S-adenosylmethionine decarboxylase [Treponema sp.]